MPVFLRRILNHQLIHSESLPYISGYFELWIPCGKPETPKQRWRQNPSSQYKQRAPQTLQVTSVWISSTICQSILPTKTNVCVYDFWLVSGFNPFQKYQSNWIISPGRGENKRYFKPPPRLSRVFPWRSNDHRFSLEQLSSWLLPVSPHPKKHHTWVAKHLLSSRLELLPVATGNPQLAHQKNMCTQYPGMVGEQTKIDYLHTTTKVDITQAQWIITHVLFWGGDRILRLIK